MDEDVQTHSVRVCWSSDRGGVCFDLRSGTALQLFCLQSSCPNNLQTHLLETASYQERLTFDLASVASGQKGSAPLGGGYFLSNWEMDKELAGNGIVALKVGPFLDTGRIFDPILGPVEGPASHEWLCDIGAQTKLSVFGSGVVFSYGKDLRSGNNVFYVSVLKAERR